MFAPAYLDHNATTPVLPAVLAGMRPYFAERYGNPSSRHEYGRAARRAIDEAREQVARAVGALPGEVIFTSGGTEANNLIIKGVAGSQRPGLMAVSAIEHPCVRESARELQRSGWRWSEIGVDELGQVRADEFERTLNGKPALVSVMLANNETGVLQAVPVLSNAARQAGALFHSDAVQGLGKVAIDFRALSDAGVSAISLSAHKIGGPKGAGALIVDKRVDVRPLLSGGGHERGLRSGTENVPAIVGFGIACELAARVVPQHAASMQVLKEALERGLDRLGATIFSRQATRLPNTSYFALADLDGETLVGKLDRLGFAVASGAACSSANPEPSHVLLSMGVAPELARGALRVSLGANNSMDDIRNFLAALEQTLQQLKRLTALAV